MIVFGYPNLNSSNFGYFRVSMLFILSPVEHEKVLIALGLLSVHHLSETAFFKISLFGNITRKIWPCQLFATQTS